MKTIFWGIVAVIGATIFFFTSLKTGQLLRFLDEHPHPRVVPPVHYYIGAGYYVLGNFQDSTTFFLRIRDRYPESRYAEDAFFNYLDALEEMNAPGPQLVEGYRVYLEKYPESPRTEMIKKRLEFAQNKR